MANVVKMIIQIRRDTAENWEKFKHIVPAEGEPCFVIDQNILKIGDGVTSFENLKPINGASVDVATDGKSLILEDNVLKLIGFNTAEVGAQPRKNANGTLEWVIPTYDERLDGLDLVTEVLRDNINALQTDVVGIKEILTPSGEGATPLLTRIDTLENKMDGNGEGSVEAKIDSKIEAFASSLTDDDKVNTLMELINYVATHGEEAADMAADIAALQGLVGGESVAIQIEKAFSGLGGSIGGEVNVIEAINLGGNALEVTDKTVNIPVGAGLKSSSEIQIAEDGTLGVGTISFSKITNDDNSTFVLDGGNAG